MTNEDVWPDADWHIGQKDHLRALGVITAAFNQLEFVLLMFFMRFVIVDPKPAQKVFALLKNHAVLDLLRNSIEAKEKDEVVKEMLLYFIAAFETLEMNRNFLSHSHSILNNPKQEYLTFGKGSRKQPDVWSFAHMSLEDIRKIADEIRAFRKYGFDLDFWLLARSNGGEIIFPNERYRPVLPDKPPQPALLKTIPHRVLPGS